MASPYSTRRSPSPIVAGSTMGVSFASGSQYLLPTITETEDSIFVDIGKVLQERCFNRQAEARSVEGPAVS